MRGRKSKAPIERLAELKARTIAQGDCWKWTGCIVPSRNSKFGYGQTSYRSISWLAHRLSYYLSTGEHPGALQVMHICDFTLCINPNHLKVGTGKDNMRDASEKGRTHNQLKTHCPSGHPYSEENLYKHNTKIPQRACRICAPLRMRRYRQRKKIARKALEDAE